MSCPNRFRIVFPALLLLLTCASSSAQVPGAEHWKYMRTITPEGYVCYRAAETPALDGRLDDPAWNAVPWTKYFVDIEGERKPLPRFKTRVKMTWDDTYFYVGAEMEEPHVWGTLAFPDQVMFYENDFEMFIDPDGDTHEYYELEMSPLAALWDMYLPAAYRDMTEGMRPDSVWNIPGALVRVHVDGTLNNPRDTDRGWSLEMALPWKGLAWKANRACPPLHGDTWRVNFSRVEYVCDVVTADRSTDDTKNNAYKVRENIPCDNWVWSPQGVVNMHCPEMWGYVQFTTAKPGADAYRPDPTLEARRILFEIYTSQRDYRGKNKTWAATWKDLGLDFTGNRVLAAAPVLEKTPEGWIARITAKLPDGTQRKMSIRQNAKVGEE